MAGITLVQAQDQLDKYLAAEAKVLRGQSVEIDGDRYTGADLAAIQKGIEIWNGRVISLSQVSSGLQVMEVIPR